MKSKAPRFTAPCSLLPRLWLLVLLAIALGVGSATTAWAADDQSSQQQATTAKGADLWRDIKAGDSGYTTAQGVETGVLINVMGNQGKDVRNQYLVPGIGYAVLIVFGLFLLFYLINGSTKLEHGYSGRLMPRWSRVDRWVHWVMAISGLAQMLTGLTLMLGRHLLAPILGSGLWAWVIAACKTVHDFVGPVFIVALVWCVVKWMPRQFFKAHDIKWFLKLGGYVNLGPFKGEHPASGFTNGGEKLWYWTLAIVGLITSVTGVMLLLPGLDLPRETSMVALIIHATGAIILISFTIAHIWMGAVLSEGSLEGMKSGYCDENWAKQHHKLWYEQMKADGSLKYKE